MHTDKPLYNPGEKVKFRVIVPNRDLKLFTVDPTIQVEAKYTYGKGVTGDFTVRRKTDYYWGPKKLKDDEDVEVTGPLGDWTGLVMVDVDIKELFSPDDSQYDRENIFDVSVTENVTGIVHNGTAKVKIIKYPYKLESISYSSNLKPGLFFTVDFKISTHDNNPIVDPSPNALKIAHEFSYRKDGSFMTSPIPANGSISLTF